MKKVFLLVCICFCLLVQAQVKEGMLQYTMTIETQMPKEMNPMSGDSELTLWFKNGKTLSEMVTPIYSMKILADSVSTLTLMDAMGQKSFFRTSVTDLKKKIPTTPDRTPTIVHTKEKKKILGYECTKAILTMPMLRGKPMNMTLWITQQIAARTPTAGIFSEEMLRTFKGLCLEMEVQMEKVHSKMIVTSISTKPVADKIFQINTAGYTERKKT